MKQAPLGERVMTLQASLQRVLAIMDKCMVPANESMAEEWRRARAEAHMILRVEAAEQGIKENAQ